METTKVTDRITQFNANENIGYHHIEFKTKATLEQVDEIEKYFEIPIPQSLKDFYKRIGGIESYNMESLCIRIDDVPSLLEKLHNPNHWYRLDSLGLIDYIRFRWNYDRYELEEGEYLDKESIQFLNEHYKCFGLHESNGWFLEENYYLYFDKNGKFGEVRYHQDEPHHLMNEYLRPLLKNSLAHENFEEMLIRIIDRVEYGVLHKDEL